MDDYWTSTLTGPLPARPALQGDLEVDVAVVGAGIVGLTAARLLAEAGKRVALLEARRVGRQATGKSTAKITSQHGLLYRKLISDFGEEAARTYGAANEAAIRHIAGWVAELAIDCGFERKVAYVYGRAEDELEELKAEADAAAGLGLPASFTREVPLPFPVAGALRFDTQAQFNPARYLVGLAAALPAGASLYEGTRVVQVEDGEPCVLNTDGGATVAARDVVVATQLPTIPEGKFFARAFPIAHPMAAARIDPARAPDGMFISSGQPSHSFRVDRSGGDARLVAVGGTYKPGHTDEGVELAAELERFLKDAFGVTAVEHRWTNEDFVSMDGVPFVGRASGSSDHLYVATGFNAWGITNGTAAGILLCDLITGRENPWAGLYDAQRVKAASGGPTFLKENLSAAAHLAKGRLFGGRPQEVELAPGEAGIVEIDGAQLAISKEDDGTLHTVSAICTHLGCVVGWNPIDRTWDCPCHGSRFLADGSVLSGPATQPLERKG